jgi:hypothetical protein
MPTASSKNLTIKSAPADEATTEGEAAKTATFTLELPEGVDGAMVKTALEAIANMTADDLSAAKAGRRNSKADQDRIQQTHDHSCALGAMCHDHNCPVHEDDESTPPRRGQGSAAKKPASKPAAAKIAAAKAGGEGDVSDEAEALGISLDKLVEAVRSKFYDLRREWRQAANVAAGRHPDDWHIWDEALEPCCELVYDGFAIARLNLTYYKVSYTIEDDIGVVLSARDTWEQVQQDWVTKSADLLALLEANKHRREIGAVKALGGDRLGNYLIVWGDQKNTDLYGEFFTKPQDKSGTQGLKAIFDHLGGKLPALYHHAMDGVVKFDPVGTIDVLEIDEVGLWMETQLDMAKEYAVAVQTLAKRKALGSSSGALPGSRKVKPDGEIAQWAIIEGSFTPTPAEPRLRELGVEVVKAIYAEAGFEFPEEAVKTGTGDEESRTSEAELVAEELSLLELELTLTNV